jgi:hypothetical protein
MTQHQISLRRLEGLYTTRKLSTKRLVKLGIPAEAIMHVGCDDEDRSAYEIVNAAFPGAFYSVGPIRRAIVTLKGVVWLVAAYHPDGSLLVRRDYVDMKSEVISKIPLSDLELSRKTTQDAVWALKNSGVPSEAIFHFRTFIGGTREVTWGHDRAKDDICVLSWEEMFDKVIEACRKSGVDLDYHSNKVIDFEFGGVEWVVVRYQDGYDHSLPDAALVEKKYIDVEA